MNGEHPIHRRTFLQSAGCLCCGALGAGVVKDAIASGSRRISIIRDAEIETFFYTHVRSLFALSGTPADSLRIFLVQDDSFNAFVNAKGHMYIYTGLIRELEHFNELIAVLAHETAHLALNHPLQNFFEFEEASEQALLGAILGMIGGVTTGSMGLAIGAASLGTTLAHQSLAEEIRAREASADLMGIELTYRLGYDPRGVLSLFDKMQRLERLNGFEPGYFLTHPLSEERELQAERVSADLTLRKSLSGLQTNHAQHFRDYQIMRIKVLAYGKSLETALRRFSNPITTEDWYGYGIVLMRYGRMDESLSILKRIANEWADYPYIKELIAAIYLQMGVLDQAYLWIKRAIEQSEDTTLLWFAYGEILMRMEGKSAVAEDWFWRALRREPWMLSGWRNLMTIYSRRGDRGMLLLSHAELSYHSGRYPQAKNLAEQAYEYLKDNNPSMAGKAQDIFLELTVQ